jgi:hypothetical protein
MAIPGVLRRRGQATPPGAALAPGGPVPAAVRRSLA